MHHILHPHSSFRIFFVSGSVTLILLGGVWAQLGISALITALILTVVELTFSFDNAIINARVLQRMSPFWQQMFLTVGIFIAVFGMRVVFPIVMVMTTTGLGWNAVIDLALNQPDQYAEILTEAYPTIASFGGMFLLMLGLSFFFEPDRETHWVDALERRLQLVGRWWLATVVCLFLTIGIALVPFNDQPMETLTAGTIGVLTYLVIHGLAEAFSRRQEKQAKLGAAVLQTGMAGFMSFLYLEVLDASFSLDSVIGAFAITQNVVLIAVGLGIGALWVRSLTMFMVKRKVLRAYRYLDHGAHYTIMMLAVVLISSVFVHIPEYVPGLAGIIIIGLSVVSSVRARYRV